MRLNRIISFTVALVLILSCLTSCAKTPEQLVENAEAALASRPYAVEVDIDFDVQSDVISGIFDEIERQEIALYFDGDRFKAVNDQRINYGSGEATFLSTYTVVDGVLYVALDYTMLGASDSIRSKALINGEKREELENKLSLVGGLSLSDFSSVVGKKVDGDHVIVCTEISDDGRVLLEKMLVSQLESASELVKAKDATMTVEIDGGKYDSVIVRCDYDVTMSGKTYTVGMTVELEYDYDERFDVSVPADPDGYDDVNIDNLV
jgi:hypothetical protein